MPTHREATDAKSPGSPAGDEVGFLAHASDAILRRIFAGAPSPMSLTRASDGRVLDANEAYAQLLGQSREHIIGRTTTELGFWPNDPVRHALARRVLNERVVRDVHANVNTAGGAVRLVRLDMQLLTLDGEDVILTWCHDETAQARYTRESNERLRLAFMTSFDGYLIVTQGEGRVVEVNDRCLDMFGYSREECIGRTVRELGWWGDMAQRDAYLALVARNAVVRNFEVTAVRKAGERFPALLSTGRMDIAQQESLLLLTIRDSTDIARAATERRQHSFILDAIAQGVFWKDADGRYMGCNQAFAEALGMAAPSDVVGTTDFDIPWLAGEADSYRADDLAVLATNKPRLRIVEPVRLRDGSTRMVETSKFPLTDRNGVPVGVVGIFDDITERRQNEAELERYRNHLAQVVAERTRELEETHVALAESIARYANLAEHSHSIILESGLDGTVLFLNRYGLDLLGCLPDNLPEYGVPGGIAGIRAESGRAAATSPDNSHCKPGEPYSAEGEYVAGDGSRLWIHWTHVQLPARSGGQPTLLSVGVDRTLQHAAEAQIARHRDELERRVEERTADLAASELRWRAAFEASGDAWAVTRTSDGCLLEVNDRFIEMFGLSRTECIGRSGMELGLYGRPEQHDAIVERFMRDGYVRGLDIEGRRKDGTLLPALYSAYPMAAPGQDMLVLVSVRDMTEHHRLEAQLRQAQKLEAVAVLAGGIAHDFNNVLAVILGYAQMLLTDLPDTYPAHAEVREIEAAAKRAADLTRQLLVFSRQQPLQFRLVDLNGVIRNLAKMLRRLIGEDIELVLALPEISAPAIVDSGQMEQMLMNLAVNARDAMPDGGRLDIAVDLREAIDATVCSAGAAQGPHVLVSVTDTGLGMDAATRERIFEPFFTTKPPGKGTGLGLPTVFGIVRQSNGAVTVESEVGRGTTFRIWLPLAVSNSDEGVTTDAAAGAPPGRTGTDSGTILLVEDEESVRQLVVTVLERRGLTVLSAANGSDGLAVWERRQDEIDMVLTDVMMPQMDGVEMARQLWSRNPRVPVLFMSGYPDRIARVEELASNAGFIQKPFSSEALLSCVRTTLARASTA
ncbi:MAG: PAS domain S-box protein [Gemmatimonadaceae bacterium]|nr:PAS domain S-box protein [Gemmatimonadaceae bacterium]